MYMHFKIFAFSSFPAKKKKNPTVAKPEVKIKETKYNELIHKKIKYATKFWTNKFANFFFEK